MPLQLFFASFKAAIPASATNCLKLASQRSPNRDIPTPITETERIFSNSFQVFYLLPEFSVSGVIQILFFLDHLADGRMRPLSFYVLRDRNVESVASRPASVRAKENPVAFLRNIQYGREPYQASAAVSVAYDRREQAGFDLFFVEPQVHSYFHGEFSVRLVEDRVRVVFRTGAYFFHKHF